MLGGWVFNGCLLRWFEMVNPETVVFSAFVTFASLVAAFRTSHALSRYVDGASLMHKMSSCWFDAMSQLITFTRHSSNSKEELQEFHEVLLRLFSLINGLCLDGLENKSSRSKKEGHRFEVIGFIDLREDLREDIMASNHQVEYVFQALQQLISDALETKVLVAAPPLLTRVLAEMGAGLTTFHEAKKLSSVPLPYAYTLITRIILLAEMLFVPSILAENTKGYFSAFTFSFGATTLLWFLNAVAQNLDNPYRKESSTLNTDEVQEEYNGRLLQAVKLANNPTPSMISNWREERRRPSSTVAELKQVVSERSASKDKTSPPPTPVALAVDEQSEENQPETQEVAIPEESSAGAKKTSSSGGFWSWCVTTDSRTRASQDTEPGPPGEGGGQGGGGGTQSAAASGSGAPPTSSSARGSSDSRPTTGGGSP